jgi:peroxiredoxin
VAGAFVFLFCASAIVFAGAEEDWQKIVALDVGPQGNAATREEARKLMLQHFDQLQATLMAFIGKYPADTHYVDANLKLSHLLAMRSDLEGKPAYYSQARKILDDLEAQSSITAEKRPAIAYARITLIMHNWPNPDNRMRETLMAYVLKFQRDFPQDHRCGYLFTEMASLYDSDVKRKRELLEEALRYADTDGLKQRINDDFKRMEMLGRPLELKFDSIQGAPVSVADYHGKVVLIYFFANWAPPSVMGLSEVKAITGVFQKTRFQTIGISLDKTREALDATLKKTGLDCPVFFDGKGWESPLVRSLGINALPTAWVLDRDGNLRTLNAIDNTEAVIRELLKGD